jgi:hypothetical protein
VSGLAELRPARRGRAVTARAGGWRRPGTGAAVPGPRPWRALVLGCVALAALARLLPAAPTYDPWAWIIWGREIAHLDLDTLTGPSWKPLPVLFTTVFSVTGAHVAPALWLVVAQAGGLLAVAGAYRLGARLAGPAAGLIAAAALVLSDEFVLNWARGNSEGLLVALCLFAIERHLDRRWVSAFALGCAAGLLRPEVWPALALYGLWLGWKDPRRRGLVVAAGALVLALWLLPEWWGSGEPLRAASRAREPNPDSAAFAAFPFAETFRRSRDILMLPVLVGGGLAVLRAVLVRDRLRLALGGMATGLMVAVAAMTQAGFAGNLRYVALPAALVCVLAGAFWVELVRDAGRRLGVGAAVALALLAAAFGLAGVARSDAPGQLGRDLRQVRDEAWSNQGLQATVTQAGGAAAVRASCAPVYAPPFEVPAVAWSLGVHLEDVLTFASAPGTTVAPLGSPLARDPRFPRAVRGDRWAVARQCAA